MAESPDLLPLSQAPNPNLAGYVAAYFLPQADLLQEPELAGGAITQDLVLAPGAGWHQLPYTLGTLKFDEPAKPDRGGTAYQVRVSAQRPQPTPAILAALALLDRRPLVLLLVEAGGGRRLIGSKEEYLLLATTGEGQSPATKSGVELRFEGSTTQRAPYYAGAVPVLGGPTLAAPTGAGGPSGYVSILDKQGNLVARVPAGATVTIASGFRVALSFG